MVDRISQYNISHIQFIPTLYWWDKGPLLPNTDADSNGCSTLCCNYTLDTYYCFNRFNSTEVDYYCYNRLDGQCPPVTEADIDLFKTNLGICMKYAVDKGFNLAVNARLDDGRGLGGWRNTLNFSPIKRYGGYSYEEAVLNPLADALGSAMRPDTDVAFTLQGEMGATLFYHPTEWIGVADRIRQRLLAQQQQQKGKIQIGFAVNNNKLSGSINIGIVDAYEYLATLPTDFPTSDFDYDAIKQAFTRVADYISISAYIPMPNATFALCDLEGLLVRMDTEMAYFNITVKELANEYSREIHYSEYGVGGGTDGVNSVPARTGNEAAYYPFFGVSGSYDPATDPFQIPEVREYRRYFYNKTAEYFEQGGCEYSGVTIAYLWPLGSWDVLGVYPGDDGYIDPVVIETINRHNSIAQQVNGETTA